MLEDTTKRVVLLYRGFKIHSGNRPAKTAIEIQGQYLSPRLAAFGELMHTE